MRFLVPTFVFRDNLDTTTTGDYTPRAFCMMGGDADNSIPVNATWDTSLLSLIYGMNEDPAT